MVRDMSEQVLKNMSWVDKWAYGRFSKWLDNQKMRKGRQIIASYADEPEAKIRIPRFREEELLEISKNHWLIRTIIKARTDDIINAGWEIKARFRKKCNACGKEYQDIDVEECDNPGCKSKDFDEPDIEQYKKFDKFLKEPAPNKTMERFIRSTYHYGFALDKYMWEIAHVKIYDPATLKYARSPALEIRVLDTSTIEPIVNAYGDYGNYEWFCPLCYKEKFLQDGRDPFIDIREYIDSRKPIPPCSCGGEYKPTAYVQNANGKIVARWTIDEVVAEFPQAIEPSVEGLSSIVPAVKHLFIIDFMDSYNLQVYSQGDVGSFIVFPDTDDIEVQEIQAKLENKLRQRKYKDVITGQSEQSLQILTAMIGIQSGKEPKRLQLMESLDKLQSIDFYALYVEKVCNLFGVVPTFTPQESQSSTGNRLTITYLVPNSVTRASIKNFEETFNNKLLPKLKIEDWVLKFGKIESKDLMRDAQIRQTNMMAVSLAIDKGFDVEVTPDVMGYTVSSEPTHEPLGSSRLAEGKIPQGQDGAPQRTMPSGRGGGTPVIEPDKEEK